MDDKTCRILLTFLFPGCVANKLKRANYTCIISHDIIPNLKLTLYNFTNATKL